jgi:hypothetical protein
MTPLQAATGGGAADCEEQALTSVGPRNVSDKIADYATPGEIEAMVVALRKRLRQYEALDDVSEDAKRRSIKRALRAIRKGKVPFAWDERYGATDILAPILTQFDAAFEKVYKESIQRMQVATTAAEHQASRN